MSTIYARGVDIYSAGVAGAKRGYNRSTYEHKHYADLIGECYSVLVADIDDEAVRQQVIRNTNGTWQFATLPLSLALLHHHKGGKKCETHARVYLATNPASVFDIPLSHWQRLCVRSEKHFKKAAA